MEISIERWKLAQEKEIKLQNPDYKHSEYGFKIIAKYLDINFKKDFKDKTIIEVGAGPHGAILICEGNFKRGVVVEPLINDHLSSVRKIYEENNITIVTNAYEQEELGHFDETWLFNVLQHVICPEKILKKAAKTSNVIRVFESIDQPINVAHPHLINKSTFTTVLGDFGQIFKGGSIPNFHSADCYYGTWVR